MPTSLLESPKAYTILGDPTKRSFIVWQCSQWISGKANCWCQPVYIFYIKINKNTKNNIPFSRNIGPARKSTSYTEKQTNKWSTKYNDIGEKLMSYFRYMYSLSRQNATNTYSFGPLVRSHLALAFVLMLRPHSPELVLFPEFEFRTQIGALP